MPAIRVRRDVVMVSLVVVDDLIYIHVSKKENYIKKLTVSLVGNVVDAENAIAQDTSFEVLCLLFVCCFVVCMSFVVVIICIVPKESDKKIISKT